VTFGSPRCAGPIAAVALVVAAAGAACTTHHRGAATSPALRPASAGQAPLAGPTDAAPAAGEPAVAPAAKPYDVAITLGVGDVFEVRVYMEPDLSGDHRVGPDGRIVFPLIGQVVADGQTPTRLAQELRERLSGGYLNDPQVTVFVKELVSKKVHVFGKVNQPGTFAYAAGMTIIEAITLAGGFQPTAARDRSQVTRLVGGLETRVAVNVDSIVEGRMANFALKPGDIVYVPETFF
jgi:polysaccharide export outer membrane protein